MYKPENIKTISQSYRPYIWALACVWTIVIALSIVWNIAKMKQDTLEMARIHARDSYNKDIIYRQWNAMHGGVYVYVTEETPPNPYLSDIPERDIVTPSGKILTLMNPAYMTRQVYELSQKEHGSYGRITSLNPIRPENEPDPWEIEALRSFERGETEVTSVEEIEGEEHMRLMRPLIIQKDCLKCHAKQGYKEGDIRGGISISVRMEPLWATSRMNNFRLALAHAISWMIGMGGIVFTLVRLNSSEKKRKQAEEEVLISHSELLVLYKVSSAISQTIDTDKLFDIVLDTVTGLDILNLERKGGIFIVEGDRMKLVSHLGHPEVFLNLHKDMKVGDCLCGFAAKTGEIVISNNSDKDCRHTICYPEMTPHGHIIIPLKARDKVVGVLYLYLPTDFGIDESRLKLFTSIGNQIGVAIDNSRLYEETKKFSLHDPLTGLANRRLMDIMIEKSLARVRRLKTSLSVIMLDIDHFKKYNDTYGHTAGDNLLVQVAKLILKMTRQIDLAVRYGGEEFLVLLPETELTRASEVAERIRKTVEGKTVVTISLGVSSYHKGIEKEEDLIKKADEALYKAKQKGRNRVEISEQLTIND